MDVWQQSIEKALAANEESVRSNENYTKAYEELMTNLQHYNETYSPSVLVPICGRAFMKGNLVHTNEITVSLGCGYFTKTNTKGAVQICKRRIEGAKKRLEDLKKEADLLSGRVNFVNEDALDSQHQEIAEPFDELEEKKWREERRSKVAKSRKLENEELNKIDDKELMDKLDALELREDLEYLNSAEDDNANESHPPSVPSAPKEKLIESPLEEPEESPELAIRRKLAQLRQRKKTPCVTEEDIFKRLDELEQEEELENELDRYYEENSNVQRKQSSESDADSDDSIQVIEDEESVERKTSKRVSFAEDIEKKPPTVTIGFKHSAEASPALSPADEIHSPANVIKIFPQHQGVTKSIIKNSHKVKQETHIDAEPEEEEPITKSKLIEIVDVIGEVVEHVDKKEISEKKDEERPTSLFRKMRKGKNANK